MDTSSYPTRILFVFFLFMLSSFTSYGQSKELENIKDALSSWQSVSQHIQIQNLANKKSPDSVRFMAATIVVFGQATTMLVEFKDEKKKRVTRLYIALPAGAQLSTEHFRTLFEQDFTSVMPRGVDAAIAFKELEITFDDNNRNRVNGATVNLQFGTWAPLEGSDAVTLVDLSGKFSISGFNKGPKQLEVALDSYLLLPENLSKNLGIGETKLKTTGYINTTAQQFVVTAHLASNSIPLVSDKSVMLLGGSLNLAVMKGKPEFFLAGQISLQANGAAIMPTLSGQVSIDIKGTIYGEAWMADEWNNPFNLNPNVSITRLGFGFGVNFTTLPIPTPILAMEGGLTVRGKDRSPRFSGSVTLAIDLGNPTRNMIDAEVAQLYVSDLVDAFSPNGAPAGLSTELRKIEMSAAHLTIVPPGPGITLFGREYKPGFLASGAFSYNGNRGVLYVKSNEEGLEAYGGLTPINFSGFSFTGTKPNTGPSMFLMVKPAASNVAFALNGNLKIMDVSTKTDVYMSDAGFNIDLEGNLFNTFRTKLVVAGNDIIKGDGVYVKASMQNDGDLVQKISKEASEEINRLAKEVQANYDNATKGLEQLRPQMQAADVDLKRKQGEVKVKWQLWCNLLNQRAAQDAERAQLEQTVASWKMEINQLEAKLAAERYSKATELNPTTCSGNSKAFQDYCYSPPPGYQWDILQPVNGPRATFTPEKREQTKPTELGTFNILSPCAQGWPDALTGKCYTCPPGFQKDGLATNCVKITPVQYAAAVRGQYIGCGSEKSFADILTGKCWQCPAGYERKASLNAITTDQACELIDLATREGTIRDKRVQLAGIEAQLTLINKGIGELATQLTSVATDACTQISNTEAINADPEVAPYFAKWAGLSLQVNELQAIVKTVGETQVGALNAAAWIVQHGGSALGVVKIDQAEFEGCLSATHTGMVSLKVNGKFAGNPLNASLKIDLKSPDQFIQEFARTLMAQPNPQSTYSNGTCTRPNVPRPQISSANIEELMKFVNEGKPIELQPRPKRETAPSWAAEKRQL